MKHLIFLSPYFYPEDFQFNKLYFELAKKNKVIVITGIPNYRNFKFFKGYKMFSPFKEIIKNLTIYRLPIIPRFNNKLIAIFLFYFSFFISAFLFSIIFSFIYRNKIKDILTFCGSPVFVGFIGNLMAFITKSSSSLWVQDIWPEAIVSAKKINLRYLKLFINFFQNYMWSSCNNLFCQSDELQEYLKNKFPRKNVKILYNPSRNKKFKNKNTNNKNNKFINVVYVGNIGYAQNLEPAINSFSKNKNIILHLYGDGNAKSILQEKYESNKIKFYGWVNERIMSRALNASDLGLISLDTYGRQKLILPGKIQTYLQYGLPILSINSGATNHLVNKYSLGISIIETENNISSKLKIEIKKFLINRNEIKNNCEKFYKNRFSLKFVMKQYLNEI